MLKRILAAVTAAAALILAPTGAAHASTRPVVPSHVGHTSGKHALTGCTTCFYYGVASEDVTTYSPQVTGMTGNLDIYKPTVNTAKGDIHSLVEMEAEDTSGNKIEIGWNVDPNLYGDSNTHFFTFYWVANSPQSYNTNVSNCGGAVTSPTTTPGATLLTTTTPLTLKNFNFQHSGSYWWIGYNGGWVGCFDDTLWSGNFTRATFFQVFAEVASSHDYASTGTRPCAQMGSGVNPNTTTTGAARFGNFAYYNNTTQPNFYVRAQTSGDTDYGAIPLSSTNHRSGYFGGSTSATSPTC